MADLNHALPIFIASHTRVPERLLPRPNPVIRARGLERDRMAWLQEGLMGWWMAGHAGKTIPATLDTANRMAGALRVLLNPAICAGLDQIRQEARLEAGSFSHGIKVETMEDHPVVLVWFCFCTDPTEETQTLIETALLNPLAKACDLPGIFLYDRPDLFRTTALPADLRKKLPGCQREKWLFPLGENQGKWPMDQTSLTVSIERFCLQKGIGKATEEPGFAKGRNRL